MLPGARRIVVGHPVVALERDPLQQIAQRLAHLLPRHRRRGRQRALGERGVEVEAAPGVGGGGTQRVRHPRARARTHQRVRRIMRDAFLWVVASLPSCLPPPSWRGVRCRSIMGLQALAPVNLL